MDKQLNQKLEILHFINEARWSSEDNYYMPNYHPILETLPSSENKDEAKLLTHWLCYISDRQTLFRRIFEDGANVYSYIVYLFYRHKDRSVIDILNECFYEKKLICPDTTEPNKTVSFAPRFVPADIVCIYKTLVNLRNDYHGSFGEFLKQHCQTSQIGTIQLSSIQNLAVNLYVLTYENIGQPTYNDIIVQEKLDNNTIEKLDKNKIEKFSNVNFKGLKLNKTQTEQVNLKKKFTKQVISTLKANRMYRFEWNNLKFLQKRLWCVIRDFLRYKHFNDMFVKIVGNDFSIERNQSLLKDLELPGDVWNQNDKFKTCFWKNNELSGDGSLPKQIREFYQNQCLSNDANQFIPEDYDITFEFVPRMCAKDECKVCPFNMSEGTRVLEMCHQRKGCLCPVIKFCSGSNFECLGSNQCPIQKYHQ